MDYVLLNKTHAIHIAQYQFQQLLHYIVQICITHQVKIVVM